MSYIPVPPQKVNQLNARELKKSAILSVMARSVATWPSTITRYD